MDSSGPNWALLGFAGLLWTVLGRTGLYLAALDCTGLYWLVLGCTGLVKVVRMISLDDMHSENIWFSWSIPSNY